MDCDIFLIPKAKIFAAKNNKYILMVCRTILFLILLLNSFICVSQDSLVWKKNFGSQYNDIIGRCIVTSDKGYLLYGAIKRDVPIQLNGFDWGIYKLDSCGNKQWNKFFMGSTPGPELYSVKQTLDNGYLLVGRAAGTLLDFDINYGGEDPWVFKLDSLGNIQWKKNIAGSINSDAFYSSYTLPDSSYLLGGNYNIRNSTAFPQSSSDYGRLTRIDKNGNIVWDNIIDTSIIGIVWDIALTNDNKIIAVGFCNNMGNPNSQNYGRSDAKIAVYSLNGVLQWNKTIREPLSESFRAVLVDGNDNIYAVGYTNSNTGEFLFNHGSNDIMLYKFDKVGNKIWSKVIGGTQSEDALDMEFFNPSTLIITGTSSSNDGDFAVNNGGLDAYILKVDTAGNILSNQSFGGTGSERALSIAVNKDRSYVIAGYTGLTPIFGNTSLDIFISKFRNIPYQMIDTFICAPIKWNSILINKDTSILFSPKDACGNIIYNKRYNFYDQSILLQTINDTAVNAGTRLNLITQSNGNIVWRYDRDLSCLTCNSPVVQPNTTNTYFVTAANNYCTSSDTVTIAVKEMPSGFYVPSAFTPNSDGLNDLFRVFGSAIFFEILIYNRWGELVFKSNDIKQGWDGIYKGKLAAAGGYTFSLKYTLQNDFKMHMQKGILFLLL